MFQKTLCQYLQLAGLLLLVALLINPAPAQAQDPTSPETNSPFDPRFGVVDSFVNTAEANAAGVGWTRVFFRWDVVQPGGPSDWKPTNVPDTFLNAETEAGREVVAVLIGTPAWATDSRISTAVPPLEFWGEFVFKIATQYQGRIKHWVIWHQPDITDPASASYTWAGNEEDYYRLVKEAYQKIKSVDPQMQVHLAGLTYTWDRDQGRPQYLARLLDVVLADPQAAAENYYFDTVSYHIYYDPRQIFDILTDVRGILAARGLGSKPIWINETNAPPSEDYLEPLAAPAAPSISLQEQSAFVIQAFAMALVGGAERIAFNKMRNETNHPESVEPYGLLRGDNSRRPAFDAFRTVTTHFANTQTAAWQQVGNVYVVTLDRAGQTTTVVWNTATTPVTVPLPAIAAEAILVDEQGDEQPTAATDGIYNLELPGASCSNGSNCFIGGAPRLLIEVGAPAQRPVLPAAAPQVTATPLAVPTPSPEPTNRPTAAPPPTLTPLPTLPAAAATAAPLNSAAAQSARGDNAPLPAALPDPGVGQVGDNLAAAQPISPTLTVVPPITFRTVMSPRRILWLFIIGLIVFTVSYGVQVTIWYRFKR